MGSGQCVGTILILSAQLVLSYPMWIDTQDFGECLSCPAGEFQKSCRRCEPCPAGSYVETMNNQEETCHLCFRDCLPKYNLRVVQNCTSTTPLKCVCELGFRCIDSVARSDNCRKCEKKEDTTVAMVTPQKGEFTTSSLALGLTKSCQTFNCGLHTFPESDGSKSENTNVQLAVIWGLVIFLGCVTMVTLFCIRRTQNKTCFRQTLAKLCIQGHDAAHKTKEPAHQCLRDSYRKQPSSPSSAALGSVHVHNPGTVIFSFLSQFTGQVGFTSGKRPESVSNEEDKETGSPVFHSTSSPSVHLSEEEKRIETGDLYTPFQEQGKDCQLSKEEMI